MMSDGEKKGQTWSLALHIFKVKGGQTDAVVRASDFGDQGVPGSSPGWALFIVALSKSHLPPA